MKKIGSVVKKFPDEMEVSCWKCGAVYVYSRGSRSGLTYWLAPDEILCECFQPSIVPETFDGAIEYVKVWPRSLKLCRPRS